jgi:hypothetical protein
MIMRPSGPRATEPRPVGSGIKIQAFFAQLQFRSGIVEPLSRSLPLAVLYQIPASRPWLFNDGPSGLNEDQKSEGGACKNFYLDAGATFVSMSENVALQKIAPLIHEIRGERVILDSDLSAIYGVDARSLMQAVKRNIERFPSDFAFQLSTAEYDSLRSQIVISKGRGGRRYLPHAFTEHGAIMAANVLNSKQAVQMSVFVVDRVQSIFPKGPKGQHIP